MKLKEKCIYYNSLKGSYYLVLSISDRIYGRYGTMKNPSYLDNCMHRCGTGLRFKIDNIIINANYIRNYTFDNKELDEFELIKELTDEEFYTMDFLISSYYKYPDIIIDIHKHMNDVSDIVNTIKHKKSEVAKLEKDIHDLEKKLFVNLKQ